MAIELRSAGLNRWSEVAAFSGISSNEITNFARQTSYYAPDQEGTLIAEYANRCTPVSTVLYALKKCNLNVIATWLKNTIEAKNIIQAQPLDYFNWNDTEISDLADRILIVKPNQEWKGISESFAQLQDMNSFHHNVLRGSLLPGFYEKDVLVAFLKKLRSARMLKKDLCTALEANTLCVISTMVKIGPASMTDTMEVVTHNVVQQPPMVQVYSAPQYPSSVPQQVIETSWQTMTLSSIFYKPSPEMMENTLLKKSQLKTEQYFEAIPNRDAIILEAIAEGVTIDKSPTYRELSSVQFIQQRLGMNSKIFMKLFKKANKEGKKLSGKLLTALTSKDQEQMLEDMQDHQDIAELADFLESKSSKIGQIKHKGKGMKVSDLLSILTNQCIYDVEGFKDLEDPELFKDFKKHVTLSFPQIRALQAALN
uniref:Uncharacterized protein n=1 Tax=Marseillevirus LCMAC202 TaxID=2506606 RepID=A0A481YXJ5_9VIRU|nr:MAG: hypothetical protein LCMAC202_02100 [Marseillevirus LCMAC202]